MRWLESFVGCFESTTQSIDCSGGFEKHALMCLKEVCVDGFAVSIPFLRSDARAREFERRQALYDLPSQEKRASLSKL